MVCSQAADQPALLAVRQLLNVREWAAPVAAPKQS